MEHSEHLRKIFFATDSTEAPQHIAFDLSPDPGQPKQRAGCVDTGDYGFDELVPQLRRFLAEHVSGVNRVYFKRQLIHAVAQVIADDAAETDLTSVCEIAKALLDEGYGS